MAYITAQMKFPTIMQTMAVRLYFPTDLPEEVGNKVKGVLTLLHGLSNSSHDWMMMSAATRYAADNALILVVPEVTNSFYNDMAYGPAWHTILTELLPQELNKIFKIPTAREMNFIAGLSMGGYGALRTGLAHPGRYAAIGSFSGAVDIKMRTGFAPKGSAAYGHLAPVFGPDLQVPEECDPVALAHKVAALPKEQQPRIFCTCGRQDEIDSEILKQNYSFAEKIKGLGLDYTYHEWDGLHEWDVWDRSLAEFIGFALNNNYGDKVKNGWALPEVVSHG